MFTAALLTTAKTGEQPKRPSTQKWIKMWYICTMEYYSTLKKNEITSFAVTQMDLESVTMSEVSLAEEKYLLTSLICEI